MNDFVPADRRSASARMSPATPPTSVATPPTSAMPTPVDWVRIFCAILLPPLGVFLRVGIGAQFWLNVLLTLCGYIPGVVHAVWIIAKRHGDGDRLLRELGFSVVELPPQTPVVELRPQPPARVLVPTSRVPASRGSSNGERRDASHAQLRPRPLGQ